MDTDAPLLDAEMRLTLKVVAGEACLVPVQRPMGKANGLFSIPETFFEPLPAALVKLFNGDGRDHC